MLKVAHSPKSDLSKRALVVLHMQTAPPDVSYFPGIVSKGIGRISKLIETAKTFGIPILYVERARGDIHFPEIWDPTGYIFIKEDKSPFSDPKFVAFLEGNEIQEIILCGYSRSYCIEATAQDAITRGYTVKTSSQLLFSDGLADDLRNIRRTFSTLIFLAKRTDYYVSVVRLMESLYLSHHNNHMQDR